MKYTDGHACFLFFFIPIAIVGLIIQGFLISAGGVPGFIAAVIVAGILYAIWFNNTKSKPEEKPEEKTKDRTVPHP